MSLSHLQTNLLLFLFLFACCCFNLERTGVVVRAEENNVMEEEEETYGNGIVCTTDDETGEETCQYDGSIHDEDEFDDEDDDEIDEEKYGYIDLDEIDEYCYSNVLLYNNIPAELLPMDDEETVVTTFSLIQDHPSFFPKMSRFTIEFESAALRANEEQEEEEGRFLHVSANGDHEGWFVYLPYEHEQQCIIILKAMVAREIVAAAAVSAAFQNKKMNNQDEKIDWFEGFMEEEGNPILHLDLKGPHKLLDEEGKLFSLDSNNNNNNNGESCSSNPILKLHLLLPREAFVHEAVKEGFVRTLSDQKTTLTTLSISPRVFLIDPIIPIETCDELIDSSKHRFRRSGEHHYSEGFDDYRTSLSAYMDDTAAARTLHQRVMDITAMTEKGVEWPSLLKYNVGTSWYKEHMDYFHQFQDRPLEDVRMFVMTRADELIRFGISKVANVLTTDHDDDKDDNAGENIPLDDLSRNIQIETGKQLVQLIGLSNPNGLDERRLVHDYLLHGTNDDGSINERINHERSAKTSRFSNVGVLYAAICLKSIMTNQKGALMYENSHANEGMALLLANEFFRMDHTDFMNEEEGDVQDYIPYFRKPTIEFNRHVTVLPILRAATEGGHTVFPYSNSNLGIKFDEPHVREDIDECNRGLIIKPKSGQALMFYSKLPNGTLDPKSQHAGCPTREGEKFAANCFTWDVDQAFAWRFQMDIDDLYQ